MDCTYRLSLSELISRPAVELRLVGSDGDNDKGGDSGDQNNSDGGDKGQDGDDTSNKGGESDKGEGLKKASAGDWSRAQRKIEALDEEKSKHYDLRKEAEAKLTAAENRIKDLEKNGTTDDDTKKRLGDLETENANLKVVNNDLALENAFLKSNKHKWKNSAAALKLADLKKVEIDEKTGDVLGLDAALEALAQENPWLLEADENDGDKSDKTSKPKKTGTPPSDKGDQGDKSAAAVKARLQSKYPGLRR